MFTFYVAHPELAFLEFDVKDRVGASLLAKSSALSNGSKTKLGQFILPVSSLTQGRYRLVCRSCKVQVYF